MGIDGHLVCRDCHEWVQIGKLSNDEVHGFPSFHSPDRSAEMLGRMLLGFLRRHLNHHIMILDDMTLGALDRETDQYFREVCYQLGDDTPTGQLWKMRGGYPPTFRRNEDAGDGG